MYIRGIKSGLEDKLRSEVIARKVFLSFPTFAFKDKEEMEFELLNSISNQFKIPINAIQVAGSGKTGYSFINDTDFNPSESDLDIAIIDPNLFQQYHEIVFRLTKGFSDLSGFKKEGDRNDYTAYRKYILKGIFRPDLIPACEAKKKWFNYFNKLSAKYIEFFLDINAGIYFSQLFFEFKQAENIELYKSL